MKKVLLAFLVPMLSGIANAQYHGIDSNWYSAPVQLTPSVSSANCGGAVANNMVVKADGTVIIFYKENNQNYWAGSNDGGITWTNPSPSPVAPCIGMIGTGTISADIDISGNTHIIWSATSPSGLFYSSFNSVTQTWSAYQQLNNFLVSSIGFRQVSTDRKGRLHAMWQDGDHNSTSDTAAVYYTRSIDGGITWSTQASLSDVTDDRHDAFPVADFSGTTSDTLIIPWRQNTGTSWDVYGAKTTDGGLTWSAPFLLSGGNNDQWDPNIVIDKNGLVHLFYHLYPTPNPTYTASVHYTYSADGGTTWSSLATLSDPLYRGHLIKTAYDHTNNLVWCFWKDERDFNFSNGNPEADVIGVSISHNGSSYTISSAEFISDGDSIEYGYHNFKIGADGIVRAHFVNMVNGQGENLYYTQRDPIVTGVEETANYMQLMLYPNPAEDEITVQLPRMNANGTIYIYDSTGRLANEAVVIHGKGSINICGLSSGLYLVVWTDEIGAHTRKLLKK